MKTPKQVRETRQIEMVETYNISTALHRLRNHASGYDNDRVARAVYHALHMSGGLARGNLEGVRVALGLA